METSLEEILSTKTTIRLNVPSTQKVKQLKSVFFVYLGLALRFDFMYLEISIILTGLMVLLRYILVSILDSRVIKEKNGLFSTILHSRIQ